MNSGEEILVSVIIPNYNHGKYLRQRLTSVLQQSFQNFEIIILDDHSTDDSILIIEEFRNDQKISTILVSKENSGSPFIQWNKGIAQAKGKWIWIAESDDWCELNFLEELMSNMDDSISLAFCQSIVINQNEKAIWQTKWRKEKELLDGKAFISQFLLKGNYIVNASMCIFQKKFYDRVSAEFTQYKFIGDWILWLELSSYGNVFISGKQLNYFRKHDRDVSGKAFSEGLGYYEYFSFIEKKGEKNLIPSSERINIYKQRFYEFLNDHRIDAIHRKNIFSLFRSKLSLMTFYFLLKNWIVKNVKSPIRRLISPRKINNGHFSPIN